MNSLTIICWGLFTDEKPNLLTALFIAFSTLQSDNVIMFTSQPEMLIH